MSLEGNLLYKALAEDQKGDPYKEVRPMINELVDSVRGGAHPDSELITKIIERGSELYDEIKVSFMCAHIDALITGIALRKFADMMNKRTSER